MTWVEQSVNSFYPPYKRRRVNYGHGPDDDPLDYDPEFAAVVDDSI